MSQVVLCLHPSLDREALAASAKAIEGVCISLQEQWTVLDLIDAIERHCAESGLGVRVTALVNQARGAAAPPHEPAASHFADGDRASIVGDIQAHGTFPGADSALTASVERQRTPNEPVPILIFTGFLGAGKTTVLNHLLMGQRDKKFAVLENEFGEVPIDNELLQNSAMDLAEQVVVMENGCMCCTVRGDLLGAFDAIRKQMQTGSPLDAVLVETTGMADPVPIVRTLRTTPDIARHFRLDGTITLVDTKTILARLEECAKPDGAKDGADEQERHRQISFADKILLNKLDLVNDEMLVEVFHAIRGYNASAKVVGCVRGVVPPSELTGLRGFDASAIADELVDEETHGGHGGHGGGHGHGHGHEEEEEEEGGHGHGRGHGSGGAEGPEESHGRAHGHGHGSSRHDAAIGSFSIVRRGMEVEPLAFARWVRIIATLPEEQGKLYRSKGVLAAAGRPQKLIFHAVADVTEVSDGPGWGDGEDRVCKIVFIGKKLARKEIQERFLQMLTPVRVAPAPRPPLVLLPSPSESFRDGRFSPDMPSGLPHYILLGVWSRDILRLSQTCTSWLNAISSPGGFAAFQRAAKALSQGAPRGMQTAEGELWLHALLPIPSIRAYVFAWREAKVTQSIPGNMEYPFGAPLVFDDVDDVIAAGVMWMELCELKAEAHNFLVEFRWRPETMKSFFDVEGSSTNSSLVKITVEDAEDSENDDDLRFRINLVPEVSEETQMKVHRMSLQLVGGKTSSRIYQIFFHTVDPLYQIHINVPDHRQPIFPTREVFHRWHPLMAGLRRRPRLRFLLRLKPMDSGPLDAMCGCCG